nr:hypothetical protein [Tanacetum cinerariifolium]
MLQKETLLDVVGTSGCHYRVLQSFRWKELSKEASSKILPYGDGSCWKTFKPIAILITKERRDEKKRLDHLKQDQTMLVIKRFSFLEKFKGAFEQDIDDEGEEDKEDEEDDGAFEQDIDDEGEEDKEDEEGDGEV